MGNNEEHFRNARHMSWPGKVAFDFFARAFITKATGAS